MRFLRLKLLITKWIISQIGGGGPYVPTYIYDDEDILITDDEGNPMEAR